LGEEEERDEHLSHLVDGEGRGEEVDWLLMKSELSRRTGANGADKCGQVLGADEILF